MVNPSAMLQRYWTKIQIPFGPPRTSRQGDSHCGVAHTGVGQIVLTLQEHIASGQRVEAFEVEVFKDGEWHSGSQRHD